MIFYEEFLKKLGEAKYDIKEIEEFSPDWKRVTVALGIGIPLILIALFQLYLAKFDRSYVRVIFAIVFIFFSFKQFKTTFSYRIKLDMKNQKINFMKTEIGFETIESCTLREGKIGKRVETVLDIITLEKKQYIIPLYMNKSLKFVYCLKEKLEKKFIIKK